MVSVYPIFQDGGEELIELFKSFPPEFLTAIGINLDNLFSIEPFYAFSFINIGLLSAIMAVEISVTVFSREKRSKCMDFILTKPIERVKIFIYKLASCLTTFVLSNVIYILCTLIIFFTKDKNYNFTFESFQLVLAPFLTQLVFMSFGIFISVIFRKIRSVSVISSSIGIIAFILSTLMNLLEKEYLNFLAPLKYFEPSYIVNTGAFDTKLVVFSIIITIITILLSVKKYCSKDISYI
jgi:ABC-2 type transport system permease protein